MIHNDERDAITVLMDYRGTNRVRPFYCVRCGKCVCELTGEARAVIPGTPDESERTSLGTSFVARCGGVIYLGKDNRIRCTAKYYFN